MKPDIVSILKKRILILDGAMGTMIQRYNLSEKDYRGKRFENFHKDVKGNNDLLVLTQPQIISEIHKKYLEAGADIIETNTFSSQRISMEDYDMQDLSRELNLEAARLAKEAADYFTEMDPSRPRFVAGSIGPMNRTLSLSPDVNRPEYRTVTFDSVKEAYKEQIIALIDGKVDLLLIETIFDTLNAKAAGFACLEVFEKMGITLPVMISGTITDASGRTLSGQNIEAFYISLKHLNPLSFGINCALGAKDMRPYLETLSKINSGFISCYPNAGLPNAFGEYDESPDDLASQIEEFCQANFLNIVGGCCGTTPEHIKAIAEIASKFKPRVPVV